MSPSVFQKVSLDAAHPVRRSPWLYVLIVLLSLGVAGLLVYGAWHGFGQGVQKTVLQPSTPVETPGEKADHLVLMNILNSFHTQEAAIPKKDSASKRRQIHEQNVQQVISKLNSAQIHDQSKDAQNALLDVFKQWDVRLTEASSTASLKPAFVDIAAKYSWLNTLVWLIILNRL